jgi:hypothetical protein
MSQDVSSGQISPPRGFSISEHFQGNHISVDIPDLSRHFVLFYKVQQVRDFDSNS